SQLALWQAEHVRQLLLATWPRLEAAVQVIHTRPDRLPETPMNQLGDKSLFIREIEEGLASGEIDLAVHSLKDVPCVLDDRFRLAAVLTREDPRDVLLTRSGVHGLAGLQTGSLIGTSSLRRQSQLRAVMAGPRFTALRGNVDTRLRKLADGACDALILAGAGLLRLGRPVPNEAWLDPTVCLPAPGQAALCVEVAAANEQWVDLVAPLNDATTRRCVVAERSFAAALGFGCDVPLGALATMAGSGEELHLRGMVAAPDGSRIVRVSASGIDPAVLGVELADLARARGAAELLSGAT
ncbi:MAG: hydroxymethylbilane synthase, partial [Chloroflexota bacterium]